jgi:hypothetical protein
MEIVLGSQIRSSSGAKRPLVLSYGRMNLHELGSRNIGPKLSKA